MKPFLLLLLGAGTLFGFGLALSPAASLTINPAADAFIAAGPAGNLANNNYGGAGALWVAAPGLSQGEFQSVLQFSLSAAKTSFDAQFGVGQWSVQSITLQLTAGPPNNAIFNASAAGQFGLAWMQNDSWTEGTGNPMNPGSSGITFSTLSNYVSGADQALGAFTYGGETAGTFSYALSPSEGLESDVLTGGLASLRLFAADTSVSYLFDSRSFMTTASRPGLTITAVPEPAGTVLTAGLLAAVLLRRRRRPEMQCADHLQ